MSQASDDRALRDLIECVVNGEASLEQHAQLESQLLASEAARDRYLDYVNLHAALRQRCLAPEESGELDIADFHLALARESFPNLRRHHRERQERRAEQAELDLRNQKFLRRGVDEFDEYIGLPVNDRYGPVHSVDGVDSVGDRVHRNGKDRVPPH